jgi:hypothetical protein
MSRKGGSDMKFKHRNLFALTSVTVALSVAMTVAMTVACQQSEFSSSARSGVTKKSDDGKGDPPGTDDPTQFDGPIPIDDGGSTEIAPQTCSNATIKFVAINGQCPSGSAAYAADDAGNTLLTCCPLPAGDILTTGTPVIRGGQCGANEVAVGVSNNQLLCAQINTARYRLQPQTVTCYYGSGSSGGKGAAQCSAPSATIAAMTTQYGTDACLPVPFGGLITKRTSKYCRDVAASQLVFQSDGTPVPMFK